MLVCKREVVFFLQNQDLAHIVGNPQQIWHGILSAIKSVTRKDEKSCLDSECWWSVREGLFLLSVTRKDKKSCLDSESWWSVKEGFFFSFFTESRSCPYCQKPKTNMARHLKCHKVSDKKRWEILPGLRMLVVCKRGFVFFLQNQDPAHIVRSPQIWQGIFCHKVSDKTKNLVWTRNVGDLFTESRSCPYCRKPTTNMARHLKCHKVSDKKRWETCLDSECWWSVRGLFLLSVTRKDEKSYLDSECWRSVKEGLFLFYRIKIQAILSETHNKYGKAS